MIKIDGPGREASNAAKAPKTGSTGIFHGETSISGVLLGVRAGLFWAKTFGDLRFSMDPFRLVFSLYQLATSIDPR